MSVVEESSRLMGQAASSDRFCRSENQALITCSVLLLISPKKHPRFLFLRLLQHPRRSHYTLLPLYNTIDYNYTVHSFHCDKYFASPTVTPTVRRPSSFRGLPQPVVYLTPYSPSVRHGVVGNSRNNLQYRLSTWRILLSGM